MVAELPPSPEPAPQARAVPLTPATQNYATAEPTTLRALSQSGAPYQSTENPAPLRAGPAPKLPRLHWCAYKGARSCTVCVCEALRSRALDGFSSLHNHFLLSSLREHRAPVGDARFCGCVSSLGTAGERNAPTPTPTAPHPLPHRTLSAGDLRGILNSITDGCNIHETVSLRNQHGRLVCGVSTSAPCEPRRQHATL